MRLFNPLLHSERRRSRITIMSSTCRRTQLLSAAMCFQQSLCNFVAIDSSRFAISVKVAFRKIKGLHVLNSAEIAGLLCSSSMKSGIRD